MLRTRVEAAASARWARSAPCVMLPASTIWRNRLRSTKSKCIGGILRGLRRQVTQNPDCLRDFHILLRESRSSKGPQSTTRYGKLERSDWHPCRLMPEHVNRED